MKKHRNSFFDNEIKDFIFSKILCVRGSALRVPPAETRLTVLLLLELAACAVYVTSVHAHHIIAQETLYVNVALQYDSASS